jgi:predicted MPP superfamily phosphohydrolase
MRRSRKRSTITGVLGLALTVGSAAWLASAWRNARHMHVTHDDLWSDRLPPSFDGVRLVFLSDVHAGLFYSRRRVRELVDRVNGLEPDILVLGGDNVGGHTGGGRAFYPEAARFSARLACVAVLGNHDVWEGAEAARRGLAEAGFRVLDNDTLDVSLHGDNICIAGLADLWTGTPDVASLAGAVRPGTFAVLVTHNPDVLDTALPATPGVWDLALAGHLHGGQLVFRGRPLTNSSRFGRRYYGGWTREEGVPILVSNGVGTVTLPLRHAADSQVHVITLRAGRRAAARGGGDGRATGRCREAASPSRRPFGTRRSRTPS